MNGLAWRMIWSYHSQDNGLSGGRACFMAAGSSFWTPSAPHLWEHCRPSSPSSVILFLCHLSLGQGVEIECCSWFFDLVTLSPTVVGALSAQITQLNGPFPPSAVFIGLPRCWRVCQHRYHFFIFSRSILPTSYSTAGSLPVKEHSSLKFLQAYFTTFGRAFYVFLRVLIFNFLQP